MSFGIELGAKLFLKFEAIREELNKFEIWKLLMFLCFLGVLRDVETKKSTFDPKTPIKKVLNLTWCVKNSFIKIEVKENVMNEFFL